MVETCCEVIANDSLEGALRPNLLRDLFGDRERGNGVPLSAPTPVSPSSVQQADKYQWLEDVTGEHSLAWVKAQNARTTKVLEADPRFASLKEAALKVYESPDHLAIPVLKQGVVYNTWQDAQHVRGILRRTTLAEYLTTQPHWHTVIDYDALAKQDKQEWVANGLNCLYPGDGLCLVSLSAGGEDAETLREFDLKTGKFVEHGFVLPHSKQAVSWLDKDSLLVARDWGPATMTKSGYPFVVKLWKRGQALDQAKEVFRGTENDVDAEADTLNDSHGHHVTLFHHWINTFARASISFGLRQATRSWLCRVRQKSRDCWTTSLSSL